MATVVVRQSPASPTHSPGLTINTPKIDSIPVPHKHLPFCSPGPAPLSIQTPVTPPDSPPSKSSITHTTSLLYPAQKYPKINSFVPIHSINSTTLAAALEHIATRPLPEPRLVFPWLHGLHPQNQAQLSFFIARRKSVRKAPEGIRGITIVKADGDLSRSKLKGAVAPAELLDPSKEDPTFILTDPKEGFSVRNFQIQAAKMAMVSDIVIYGDNNSDQGPLYALAERFARARKTFAKISGQEVAMFGTFVVSCPFSDFEEHHPELVAINSNGRTTDAVLDFVHRERQEMCTMSKASEISKNVWVGPTPDVICPAIARMGSRKPDYDILIEASDNAQLPNSKTLESIANFSSSIQQTLEFPSSGNIMPPTWSHTEVDSLMETCEWIYRLANPTRLPDEQKQNSDHDVPMELNRDQPRKFLIHCSDGYTESSLLALAYFMYAECMTVDEAWLRLHCERNRNFFAYPSDVALLTAIQPRLLQASPQGSGDISSIQRESAAWLSRIDGSLPSRILPYMYLGNLGHANNPELLKAMGIKQVLSVGEPVTWPKGCVEAWGGENVLFIDFVQDNGVDPLTDDFERCLEFIEKGKAAGTATLVHCRVGVSRSATICIAEVMSSMGLSFPHAYCFVRARRLNVIIQPHLRFAYELLKWEEAQRVKRGEPLRREMEWATIAREIAAMNKPYSRLKAENLVSEIKTSFYLLTMPPTLTAQRKKCKNTYRDSLRPRYSLISSPPVPSDSSPEEGLAECGPMGETEIGPASPTMPREARGRREGEVEEKEREKEEKEEREKEEKKEKGGDKLSMK